MWSLSEYLSTKSLINQVNVLCEWSGSDSSATVVGDLVKGAAVKAGYIISVNTVLMPILHRMLSWAFGLFEDDASFQP